MEKSDMSKSVTDAQILEEIETHSDNGVPPFSLPELVSELLDVPKARVRKLVQKWWKGE
jgi:hypothetical protein